eukprot:8724435-Pyramimonas_sp.AAC.1
MNLACARTEDHGVLRGTLAQQAQNYPRPMAKRMAYLIANQGMADNISDVDTAEEVYMDIDAIEYSDDAGADEAVQCIDDPSGQART